MKLAIEYERSFEYNTIKDGKSNLLKEFSNKNTKKPNEIYYKSNHEFKWNCSQCKSEYEMKMSNRTNLNCGCPYCAGKRVNQTNCLWTTHPEIAKLLVDSNRGHTITFGSSLWEYLKCDKCNNTCKKKICRVTRSGFHCPKCSDGLSYPEKFMINLLGQLKIDYEKGTVFDWAKTKIYDFYIPTLNCIIETHGSQHYYGGFETLQGRSLHEEEENDTLKESLAKENNIENYIVIDCRRSNLEFIKNSILNSRLIDEFNLNNINWYKCHEFACDSLVKKACNIKNKNINLTTTEIGQQLNLTKHTIRKYLKQGCELGWCNYDAKEEWRKTVSNNGRKSCSRKIIQLTLDDEYIKDFESMASAKNIAQQSSIYMVCKGKRNHAGGYKWMYKEDYDQYIKQQ